MIDDVVVGVPPDRVERHVLARAGEDAALRGLAGVVAVVVVEPPSFGWLWAGHAGVDDGLGAVREEVAARLETAGWVAARGAAPTVRVVRGGPVERLVEQSTGALGLYLGRASTGAPGAVALGCAFAARCPVTLVPAGDAGTRPGPVVVGLDDSQGARAAVEHAVEVGARHGRGVLVVSVLEGLPPARADDARRAVEVRSRAAVHELVVRRARARRPGTAVEVEVLEGPPAVVLCDVARRAAASLLVLGARGRGRAAGRGITIGSVATGALLRAGGPVRIVRGPRS